MKNSQFSVIDRLWRIGAHTIAARPGLVTASLAEVRSNAARQVFERYRPQAAELADGLARGEESARTELAAVAEGALAEMRAAVRREARLAGRAMALIETLDRRWRKPEARELMDDPDLDAGVRSQILESLDHFNVRLGSYQAFFDHLRPLLIPGRLTRVLDLASGHGGFALAAARAARDTGLAVDMTASDLRREYLELGEAVARREGLPVHFLVQDVRELSDLTDEGFDVMTCTQSLHHLPPGLIAVMFEAAVRTAQRGVVFIDGSRSFRTALGLGLFATLRYRYRPFVHDTWVSTRRFYVPQELALLARLGPWGEAVEAFWCAPGFCVLRSTQATSRRTSTV